jgi:hypothetical protein
MTTTPPAFVISSQFTGRTLTAKSGIVHYSKIERRMSAMGQKRRFDALADVRCSPNIDRDSDRREVTSGRGFANIGGRIVAAAPGKFRLDRPNESNDTTTLYSPSTARPRSTFHSSMTLDRDKRRSSANGAFGRQERQDSAGMRLVTAASG